MSPGSRQAPVPPDPARLFVALWPRVELQQALHDRCIASCRGSGARPVACGSLHLTLHFLGPVSRARLPELAAGLRVPFEPFELRLGPCEHWAPGLLVARPETVPPALSNLREALGQATHALGLPTDARPFRPHVTLARRHRDAAGFPRAHAPGTALRWFVQGYELVESQPGTPRAYRALCQFT